MEKAEEAAAETKAERQAALLLDIERGVVELQFDKGIADRLRNRRSRPDKFPQRRRGDDFKAGERLLGRVVQSNGIADFHIGGIFDVGDEDSPLLPGGAPLRAVQWGEDAHIEDFKDFVVGHHFDL